MFILGHILFTTKSHFMKKLLMVFAAGLLLVSCKKDWACDCKVGDITHTSTLKNKTLKQATEECNDSGEVFGVEYDCKVKVFK